MVTNNAINVSASGIVKYDGAGTFSADTVTQYQVLLGGASNAISGITLTDGQIAIGSTGIAPIPATLTQGAGISITSAAGSVTIAATGGGLAWSTVTGTTQAAAVNSGYITNNAGVVTVTLPAVCAAYTKISIVGLGVGGWTLAQNALQYVQVGASASTIGITGSISSTNRYDTVTLLCTVANTSFAVINMMGNVAIV